MRFLRRKGQNQESDDKGNHDNSYSSLGIFSPVVEDTEPDPIFQCKRLAELDSIFIRSKRLDSLDDVPFIVNQIREGNIVLLDISRLNDGHDQTHLELKRIIERIRPKIPIIVLTDENSNESFKKLRSNNVSYIAIKPINQPEIKQVIKALGNLRLLGINQ